MPQNDSAFDPAMSAAPAPAVPSSDCAAPPKALWQVLEEEFIALGGTLPTDYQAARNDVLNARSNLRSDSLPGIDPVARDLARQATENEVLLPSLYRCLHARAKGGARRSALCFSGGGIRSATFNLGVLQRLAREDLLGRFDYLSTVSGGGYLGGWLTAWIARNPAGLDGVTRALAGPDASRADADAPAAATNSDSSPRAPNPSAPLNPEPAPLRHLRTYSRYLSPRFSLASADTWTLGTIYLRNLTLNWLVLLPLLAAALLIPRFCAAVVALDPVWRGVPVLGIDPSHTSTLTMLLQLLGMVLAAWAFGYAGLHQPSANRARQSRGPRRASAQATSPVAQPAPQPLAGQTSFLWRCWLPLILSSICLSIAWAWAGDGYTWPYHVGFGIGLGVIGWTVFTLKDRELARLWELPWILIAGAVVGLALLGSAHLLDLIVPKPDPWDAWSNVGIYYATVVCLGLPLILASFSLGGTLYVGFVSRLRSTHDEDREWWARCGAWVLIAVVAWFVISGLVLFGPGLLQTATHWAAALSVGGVSTAATVLLGRSAATPATRAARTAGDRTQVLTRGLMALAAPIAIMLIIVVVSAGVGILLYATWVRVAGAQAAKFFPDLASADHGSPRLQSMPTFFRMLYVPAPGLVAAWIAGLLAFGLAIARLIDLNKFSMHGMYRDRLIRAYLGASRVDRTPDPFTGFDPMDNVLMYRVRPEVLRPNDLTPDGDLLVRLTSAARSAAKDDPVSSHLVARLTPAVRALLASASPAALTDDQRARVLDGLNRLLLEDDLAAAPAFLAARVSALATAIDTAASAERIAQDRTLRNRLLLQAAFPGAIRPLAARQIATAAPLHVVNLALNLVSGDDPAWQERKAESFSISALHSGSAQLGYRDSRAYGGPRGITLGTAMTVSGAAVSPNMGYHSSKPIAFLMTLFNVRLGWWLGNPGQAGAQTFSLDCPKYAVVPLISEAFGLTDARHRYVYLSDGGHFENLGLYEIVRRRCHLIVLGDAGCDPQCAFADLGNAVRKIRIDMGVPITFSGAIPIYPRSDQPPRNDAQYCAFGTIHYKAIDGQDAVDGLLLYVKPAFYGAEPADVFNYAQGCKDFPHETTADQFFSESQFESYRALGYHVMDNVLGCDPAGKHDLFRLLRDSCGPAATLETRRATLGAPCLSTPPQAPRPNGERPEAVRLKI